MNTTVRTPGETLALAKNMVAELSDAYATIARWDSVLGSSTGAAEVSPAGPRPPAIGQMWPEQGGVYAGIARGAPGKPDYHLIVPASFAGDFSGMKWGGAGSDADYAACEWDGLANTRGLVASTTDHPAAQVCAALRIDGHADFYLPSRRELALCYANVPELFAKDEWHWSSTQVSRHYAWTQDFGSGGQDNNDKGCEARVRAVRRFALESFSASVTSAEGGAS